MVLLLDRWALRLGIDRPYGQIQGVLAPDILVDERDLLEGVPHDVLVECCIDYCNWCVQEAGLVREEVNPDAWRSYFVDFYLAQVNNGGHGQFAGNGLMRPKELDLISEGLSAMGADDFLAVFSDFRSVMDSDPKLCKRVIDGGGFGDLPKAIEDLDQRFFALSGTSRLLAQNAAWLRSLPSLTPVSLEELRRRKALVMASNSLLERRVAITTVRRRRGG